MLELFVAPERFVHAGGPLNAQACRIELFAQLMACRRWSAIVETGTFRGETTTFLARTGLPVHTLESNPRYFGFAQLRFLLRPRVRLYLGDSRVTLARLAGDSRFPRSLVFFYLDAHWDHELPLREEIELVFTRWPDAVAMVDDFEVPGTGYGYDDYGDGMRLTFDYLAPLEHLGLHAFLPTASSDDETGSRRGCVVLCRDPTVAATLRDLPTLRPHRWTASS